MSNSEYFKEPNLFSGPVRRNQLLQRRDWDGARKESTQTERNLCCLCQRNWFVLIQSHKLLNFSVRNCSASQKQKNSTVLYLLFPDPEDAEVLSSTSEPEEPEVEDAEFQAAAQHLTQDFLCQMIQEEEGRRKTTPDSEQESGPDGQGVGLQRQVAPLAAILGKLPSTASLDLHRTFQTFNKSETAGKPDSKKHLYYIIIISSEWGTGVYPDGCSLCFSGDESDSGELDLDGIDDQEIDKVLSITVRCTDTQISFLTTWHVVN